VRSNDRAAEALATSTSRCRWLPWS